MFLLGIIVFGFGVNNYVVFWGEVNYYLDYNLEMGSVILYIGYM